MSLSPTLLCSWSRELRVYLVVCVIQWHRTRDWILKFIFVIFKTHPSQLELLARSPQWLVFKALARKFGVSLLGCLAVTFAKKRLGTRYSNRSVLGSFLSSFYWPFIEWSIIEIEHSLIGCEFTLDRVIAFLAKLFQRVISIYPVLDNALLNATCRATFTFCIGK